MSAASSSGNSTFPPVVRETLQAWFNQYGANELFEIECRVQDVGEAGFERILQSLGSHRGWSNVPIRPVVTLDVMHASGVRESRSCASSGTPASTSIWTARRWPSRHA